MDRPGSAELENPPPASGLSSRNTAVRVIGHGLIALILGSLFLGWVYDRAFMNQIPILDEYGWLATSHSTFQLIAGRGETGSGVWKRGMQATTYGEQNPNVAKLFMGFVLHCMGFDLKPPSFFLPKGKEKHWWDLEREEWLQAAPEYEPYVFRMRWVMLLLGAVDSVLVYYVGRAIRGVPLGLLAYIGFTTAKVTRESFMLVYTDPLLIMMSLISVLAAIAFIRRYTRPGVKTPRWKQVAHALGLGVLFGLTVATKMNGAILCIVFGAAALAAGVTHPLKSWQRWRLLLRLAAVGLITLSAFAAVNPQLHPNVPSRISWMLERWRNVFSIQQEVAPQWALKTLGEKAASVYRQNMEGQGPIGPGASALPAVLIAMGFLLTCGRWLGAARARRDATAPCFLVIWALISTVMVTAWVPMDWPRWYLPLVPVMSLLQAVFLEGVLRFLPLPVRRS